MTITKKPDGGWRAWFVVAASFMISFIQDGILYSFGVFLPELTTFFVAGRATTTVILSVMTFMTQGSGPLAAFLLRILGHKWTTLLGALLSCVAFLLTGLLVFCDVKNIIPYYVITGGLAGTGFGFMYLPAMTIINHWFDKNMGLATGIAAAGSGVGQFALAPLCEMLLQKVGLTWSFLIIGAIAGLGLAFGVAYIMPPNQDENEESELKEKLTTEQEGENTPNENTSSCNFFNCSFSQIYNLSLLKKPEFAILVTSNMIFHFGVYTVFGFTVDRAINAFQIESTTASWIFSAMGVANCIGRIIYGKLVDAFVGKFGDKSVVYISISILLLNGLSMIMSQVFYGIAGQMVCASIFGFTFGGYVTSTIIILKKIFEDLDSALGLVLFSCAVASIIGPVIVGAIYDHWQSYSVGYYSMGGAVIFSAIILFCIPVIERWRNQSTAQRTEDMEAES